MKMGRRPQAFNGLRLVGDESAARATVTEPLPEGPAVAGKLEGMSQPPTTTVYEQAAAAANAAAAAVLASQFEVEEDSEME